MTIPRFDRFTRTPVCLKRQVSHFAQHLSVLSSERLSQDVIFNVCLLFELFCAKRATVANIARVRVQVKRALALGFSLSKRESMRMVPTKLSMCIVLIHNGPYLGVPRDATRRSVSTHVGFFSDVGGMPAIRGGLEFRV